MINKRYKNSPITLTEAHVVLEYESSPQAWHAIPKIEDWCNAEHIVAIFRSIWSTREAASRKYMAWEIPDELQRISFILRWS